MDLTAAVKEDLARGGRVAVVVPGNPALFSVADGLLALEGEAKLLAAASSLDQVLTALRARCGDRTARDIRAVNIETAGSGVPLVDEEAMTLLYNVGGIARRDPKAFARLARRLAR